MTTEQLIDVLIAMLSIRRIQSDPELLANVQATCAAAGVKF